MWKPLGDLFSNPAKKEEAMKASESFIATTGALIANTPASSKPDTDRQLTTFSAHSSALFKEYGKIAAYDPVRAIKSLMALEKGLKANAQADFWKLAETHIQASLAKATPEIKEAVYHHIILNAHKGQIANFLVAHAEDIALLLSTSKLARNADFVGAFLSHAGPNTNAFLEKFQPQLVAMYDQGLIDRLSLTKKILKACLPISSKDKKVELPDFVAKMKDEQTSSLVKRAVRLYVSGHDSGFKQITNCMQELETLKSCSSTALKRVKGEKPTKIGRPEVGKSEKEDFYFYLYQLPTDGVQSSNADETLPKHLYILTRKPKGYGNPDDSGIITTVLATTDLNMVTKAFVTLPYDKGFQKVVADMADKFYVAPAAAPVTAPNYQTKFTGYSTTLTITSLSLSPSFGLTATTDSLNSGNEQATAQVAQIGGDNVPFQQRQPTTL